MRSELTIHYVTKLELGERNKRRYEESSETYEWRKVTVHDEDGNEFNLVLFSGDPIEIVDKEKDDD